MTTATIPAPTVASPPAASTQAVSAWQLTRSQRLHLEIEGYVIIPNLITRAEIDEIREQFARAWRDFRRDGTLGAGAFVSSDLPYANRIDNIIGLHTCFRRYLFHPCIIAMVEEMIGGRARIEQSDCHLRMPNHKENEHWHFHRGAYSGFAYTENGLYHYPFVKALTNLTDLGPDDGGTAVIPGSHKLSDGMQHATIAAALDDPSLIRQVIAPAGSTLLFYESLLHSGGIMRSGRERALIIGGYTPSHFQAWTGYDPDPTVMATLTEDERARYAGSERWHWPRRFRDLA